MLKLLRHVLYRVFQKSLCTALFASSFCGTRLYVTHTGLHNPPLYR